MDQRKRNEKIAYGLLWTCGLLALAILIVILAYIFVGGIPVLTWQFLTDWPAGWGHTGGGIYPTIIATIQITALSLLIAAPLSIGGAIYLTEYTKESLLRKIIRQGAEILAGIPSIILGLFGFLFFVIALKEYTGGWSILSGGLTLAFMILPISLRTSEEALKTVPLELREGGLGLGATKWQMIRTLVVPTALPGIITGIILGAGRAIGETAAILLTVGGAINVATSLQDPARPMTLHLYDVLTEYRDTTTAYGTAALLVIAILVITFVTDTLMNRYIRNLKGL
jgi:phosphate transport system permease protein